jgi:diguanylate cyclase (GGDEF)-like protein
LRAETPGGGRVPSLCAAHPDDALRASCPAQRPHQRAATGGLLVELQLMNDMPAPPVFRVIKGCPHPLQNMLDAVGEAFCAIDEQWNVTLCNKHFASMFGFESVDALVGESAFNLLPYFERSVFFEALENTMRTRRPQMRMGYSSRLARWAFLRVYPFDGGLALFLYDLEDVEAQRRVAFASPHDPLTSLPNRSALQRDVSRALLEHRHFSLTFIDLDRFKTVNDTLGHVAGDRMLMHIAARFRECLGADDRLYRVGGDEFVLVCPFIDSRLDALVQRLFTEAARPARLDNHEFLLGASAGAVVCPEHGDDVETLLRRADIAMYCAKRTARGTMVRFDMQMERERVQRVFLEQALRRAIDSGQLEMHYQPKAALPDMRCIGVEALLRWRHPELGLLSPTHFLSLAIEGGLSAALDQWVLTRACADLARLRKTGWSLPVSVNLTADSISSSALPELVRTLLSEHDVPACLLEIEVTEGSLMRDIDAAIASLKALDALGVSASVDDFGTGYSSLAYLLRFPVKALKIDASFIQRMADDADSRAIVRSVIALAHSLGLCVVAEGVETDAQLRELARMQCDAFQGYRYARPLLPDELGEFLATSGRDAQHPEQSAGPA